MKGNFWSHTERRMKYVFTLLILVGVAIQSGAETELPDYVTPCKHSDEKCLKTTLHSLQPHFENGIPEFQLPSLDPLYFPDFNQSRNFPPAMVYTATLSNIQFGGVNKYKVSKIKVDLDRLKFHFIIKFPLLTVTMNERANGNAIGVEINWDGISRLKLRNATIHFSLDGTQVSKEGKQYVNWKKGYVDVTSNFITYDIEDLFKNKELIKIFFENLDVHRDIIDEEVTRFVEDTLAEYIIHIINVVHESYPVEILYANP